MEELNKVGLQLFTVRDQISKDLVGTLNKCRELGYEEVETAGYANGKLYDKSASEFRKVIDQLGINAVSGHFELQYFQNDISRAVDLAAEVGMKFMVLPWLNPEDRETLDQYKAHAQLLNRTAEVALEKGIQVCYHHHDFEFDEIDGIQPIDVLLKETDPKLVKLELDLYWVAKSGWDPVKFIQLHRGRIPLWHLKDIGKSESQEIADVGEGLLDFKNIFSEANTSGLMHHFVEHDNSKDPMASIAKSISNLQQNILV